MEKPTSDPQQPSQPQSQQIGAICMRSQADGPEVLMITTRDTRRWMIPKGWPIDGLTPQEVAEREAWEEAGVVGKVKRKVFGEFRYVKILSDGREIEPLVSVYLIKVRRRKKRFPEMAERNVIWMKPAEAARHVREPELRKLLLAVARRFGGHHDLSPS
ncbi:DNA mismatch repair protein MutT [Rhizobium sp. Root708]|uniref:NUDIX hydrolase n=1 Tax=Rhizobium sp. Root708 TaxID=1736592 RepID=UPI0006FC0505|nr:NUDIX hydrolase [Rhizobium sp. Root708]KRB61534.1 DNA mismatch repair protein MutT [Rhizobium sp. Root708]